MPEDSSGHSLIRVMYDIHPYHVSRPIQIQNHASVSTIPTLCAMHSVPTCSEIRIYIILNAAQLPDEYKKAPQITLKRTGSRGTTFIDRPSPVHSGCSQNLRLQIPVTRDVRQSLISNRFQLLVQGKSIHKSNAPVHTIHRLSGTSGNCYSSSLINIIQMIESYTNTQETIMQPLNIIFF